MSPRPIPKVLSTLQKHDVRFLLMGGQACVLYGAAEFSRDMDIHILASLDNLRQLEGALTELDTSVIAVPPFDKTYLDHGLAIHFRCNHPDAGGIRLDVMSRMRGVDSFEAVWSRRTDYTLEEGLEVGLLSLPDLVAAKKTQRDKDWPMIRRLVETNYEEFYREPTPERIDFWLAELRTPEMLVEAAGRFPEEARLVAEKRDAVAHALAGDHTAIQRALDEEMEREREADRAYWAPLRKELEELRRRSGRGE